MSANIAQNAEPRDAEHAAPATPRAPADIGPAPSRSLPSGQVLPRDQDRSHGSLGLAYHDPRQAPTLARLERLVGHPVDPTKVRAAIGNFEVAPVQELLPTAAAGIPATRAPRRDASRTRSEARLALRTPLVGGEDGFDYRRFSLLDVTSGLPDDSRDEDQHTRTLLERQRQGRVRAAHEALKAHPEARELVMHDQTKQRLFCARYSITPADICPHREDPSPVGTCCGWCRGSHMAFRPIHVEDLAEVLASPCDWLAEVRAREAACLPRAEADEDTFPSVRRAPPLGPRSAR